MDFISYINKLGSFKTAVVNYDSVAGTIQTQNAINEDYLVTSVFVEGVKRLVDIDNAVQLAVINDNNFDGNILDLNHYNVEGTYFSAKLLPLVSVGGGSALSDVNVVNVPQIKLRPVTPLFNPLVVGEWNKDSDRVIYFDVYMNRNFNTVDQFMTFYRYYNPVTGLTEAVLANQIVHNKNSSYYIHELKFRASYFAGYTVPSGVKNTFRCYYDVINNVFSVASSSGDVFDPLGAMVYTLEDFISQGYYQIYKHTDPKKIIFIVGVA